MPQHCKVCTHERRAEIDRRMAGSVVNLSALSREYGMSRDSLRAHRDAHVPEMLRHFALEDELATAGRLHGEYRRLYDRAMDLLAQAESGVVVEVRDDGSEVRKVSVGNITRAIREARATLDSMARLTQHDRQPDLPDRHGGDSAMDERIAAAAARALVRMQAGAQGVVDAHIVDEDGGASQRALAEGAGPGPGERPPPSARV